MTHPGLLQHILKVMTNELILRDEAAAVPAVIAYAGRNTRFACEEFFKATHTK